MNPTRVFDLIDYYRENFGDKPDAFAGKENGQWRKWSFEEFTQLAHALAAGLLGENLQRGDTVGIISNNRPEWNIIDFGVQLAGGVLVPVYPTISETDLKFIFNDAEVKFVFASSIDLYTKAKNNTQQNATVPKLFSIDEIPGAQRWTTLIENGKQNPEAEKINEIKKSTQPDDLFTLIYTSGTTGTPKGVMLTHRNLVSNFTALSQLPPVDKTCRVLSFLPLNHSYERMLIYLYIYKGPSIYYAESLDTISANIQEIQPQMFTCVPRLLEKVYERIVAKGSEQKGVKRRLFFWSLAIGEKCDVKPGVNGWWYKIKHAIASKLVFSKWRAALGGNVRAMVSGGAALDPRLARIFWAAGLPVLEGYGLTETSPVIAVNNFEPNSVRFGTVGPVISGVTVKFAEDGEILVKGPNVMKGYYKRDDATKEVIDSEGWFHTGDIGTLEENRFLKITDRKKEIFKTSGGKYIAPQMVENLIAQSRFIEQVMVIGENRKFPSALIVPAFAFIREWAKQKGISIGTTNEEIVKSADVINRIKEEVNVANQSLSQYEKVKQPILLAKEWTVAGGELTPKLSLRRKIIYRENEAAINVMYAEYE